MAKSLNEIIAEKFGLIDQAEKNLLGAILQKENDIFKRLMDFMNLFATKNGKIDAGELSNQNILNRVSGMLNKVINTSTFQSDVSKYLKVFDQVETMSKKILEMGSGLGLSDFNLNTEKQLAIQEIVDSLMNPDMIRANMVNPVKKILYRHVTTGINIQDARNELNTFIKGDQSSGYLTKFVKTITAESLARFDGMINQKVVTEFELDAFRIVGSLIKTSMPVCVHMIRESGRFENMAINGKYAVADLPKIISKISGKPGFVKGTNPTNYFVNRNHWGCRHQFIPTRFTETEREIYNERNNIKNDEPDETLNLIEGFNSSKGLLQRENEIRFNDFETAYVFDDNGNEIFSKVGGKSSVAFTDDETKVFNGNLFTHNHPSSRAFSVTDIVLASDYNAKEMRAVGSRYSHYLRTEKEWPNKQKLKKEYLNAEMEIKSNFMDKILKNEISIEFAEQQHHHEVMKILAKKLDLIYKRIENEVRN